MIQLQVYFGGAWVSLDLPDIENHIALNYNLEDLDSLSAYTTVFSDGIALPLTERNIEYLLDDNQFDESTGAYYNYHDAHAPLKSRIFSTPSTVIDEGILMVDSMDEGTVTCHFYSKVKELDALITADARFKNWGSFLGATKTNDKWSGGSLNGYSLHHDEYHSNFTSIECNQVRLGYTSEVGSDVDLSTAHYYIDGKWYNHSVNITTPFQLAPNTIFFHPSDGTACIHVSDILNHFGSVLSSDLVIGDLNLPSGYGYITVPNPYAYSGIAFTESKSAGQPQVFSFNVLGSDLRGTYLVSDKNLSIKDGSTVVYTLAAGTTPTLVNGLFTIDDSKTYTLFINQVYSYNVRGFKSFHVDFSKLYDVTDPWAFIKKLCKYFNLRFYYSRTDSKWHLVRSNSEYFLHDATGYDISDFIDYESLKLSKELPFGVTQLRFAVNDDITQKYHDVVRDGYTSDNASLQSKEWFDEDVPTVPRYNANYFAYTNASTKEGLIDPISCTRLIVDKNPDFGKLVSIGYNFFTDRRLGLSFFTYGGVFKESINTDHWFMPNIDTFNLFNHQPGLIDAGFSVLMECPLWSDSNFIEKDYFSDVVDAQKYGTILNCKVRLNSLFSSVSTSINNIEQFIRSVVTFTGYNGSNVTAAIYSVGGYHPGVDEFVDVQLLTINDINNYVPIYATATIVGDSHVSVSPNEYSYRYYDGVWAFVTFTLDDGYRLASYPSGYNPDTGRLQLGSTSATYNFTSELIPTHTVTIGKTTISESRQVIVNGNPIGASGTLTFREGDVVTIKCDDDQFSGWYNSTTVSAGTLVSYDNPYTFTVGTSNISLYYYSEHQELLYFEVWVDGVYNPNYINRVKLDGVALNTRGPHYAIANTDLLALPIAGYEFVEWEWAGGAYSELSASYSVQQEMEFDPSSNPYPVKVKYNSSGTSDILKVDDTQGQDWSVEVNTEVTLRPGDEMEIEVGSPITLVLSSDISQSPSYNTAYVIDGSTYRFWGSNDTLMFTPTGNVTVYWNGR